MTERVAFVDRPEQLAFVPDDAVPVSLDPRVDVERDGLCRPEHYLDGERLEEMGERHLCLIRPLCDALDDEFGALTESEARPWTWHIFSLKVFLDGAVARALLAHALLETIQPAEAYVFSRAMAPDPGGLVGSGESLWSGVLRVVLDHARVSTTAREVPDRGRVAAAHSPSRRRALAEFAGQRATGLASRRGGRPKGTVLATDLGYGTWPIARSLLRHGWRVAAWPGGSLIHDMRSLRMTRVRSPSSADQAGLARAWGTSTAVERWREVFVADGIDLWPLAGPRLEGLATRGFAQMLDVNATATAAIDLVRPDALLMPAAAWPAQKAMADAARQAGVPTIVNRHGELGLRDIPTVSLDDVNTVDWTLSWGSREADWTRVRSAVRTRPVLTGSPMVERDAAHAPDRGTARQRLGLLDEDRVILFVPTNLSGNDWYASRRTPIDGDYFEHLVNVVRALAAIEHTMLVVKEHPSVPDPPLLRWSRRNLGQRASVIRTPPFAELIHLADAVVLDTPSTTFTQALLGSSHIYLVATPVVRWMPGVVEHLEAHGIAVSEGAAVGPRLAADLAAGRLDVPARYEADAVEPYLFGARTDPGRAGERAAQAVARIASDYAHPA